MITAMREDRGARWQPAQASLGATAQVLAGDAALRPAPGKHDWKRLLLWALLVSGALVVGGLAISLLRTPRLPGGP